MCSRTYYGQVDLGVSGRTVPEVYSAAVETLVLQVQFVHQELRRLGGGTEVCALAKRPLRRPQLGLTKTASSHVETEMKVMTYWSSAG